MTSYFGAALNTAARFIANFGAAAVETSNAGGNIDSAALFQDYPITPASARSSEAYRSVLDTIATGDTDTRASTTSEDEHIPRASEETSSTGDAAYDDNEFDRVSTTSQNSFLITRERSPSETSTVSTDAADVSDPLKSHIAAFQSSQKELFGRNDSISTWLADRRLQQVACAALASPDSTEDLIKGIGAIRDSNNGPSRESRTVIERLQAKVEDLSTKHKLTPQERKAIYEIISKKPDGIKRLKLMLKQQAKRKPATAAGTAAPAAPTPAPATAATARAPVSATTPAATPRPPVPAVAPRAPAPGATIAPRASAPTPAAASTPAAATRALERLSADADYRRDNPPSVRSSILDFLRAFLKALGELSVEDLAGLEEIDDAALLAFLRENDCADWLDLPATEIA